MVSERENGTFLPGVDGRAAANTMAPSMVTRIDGEAAATTTAPT